MPQLDPFHATYTTQSPITDPGPHADLLAGLPADLPGLCRVVQGLVIHLNMGDLYDYPVPDDRRAEADTREVAPMLARIRALDPQPLRVARPPARRFIGHCRVAAVLGCSLLRHQGYAARVRVGFSAYFPRFLGDHWVCEVWQPAAGRWALVDPELDEVLGTQMHLDFDPTDIPRSKFLTGARAWQMCRREGADPDMFGLSPAETGLGYIRGQLLSDLAALHKREVRALDGYGLSTQAVIDFIATADPALIDRVADLIEAGDPAAAELAALYAEQAGLRLPGE